MKTLLLSTLIACTSLAFYPLKGGDYRLLPESDSYVAKFDDSRVMADARLRVENKGGDGVSKTYLRYDLRWIKGAIQDAKLMLTGSPECEGEAPRTVQIYGMIDRTDGDKADAWNRKTLTWKNAPANEIEGNGVDPTATVALGLVSLPPDSLKDQTIVLEIPELAAFLRNDTNGLVTFILTNDSGGAENTLFYSSDNYYCPEKMPVLEVTTDSAESFDQTRATTVLFGDKPRQTFEDWGTGCGGSHFDQLDEAQRARASQVTWGDTRQTVVRLWAELNRISPEVGMMNLSDFKSNYVDGGVIENAKAAGIEKFQLSFGGHAPVPDRMLTTETSPEAGGQRALKAEEVENYGKLLAATIDALKKECDVEIDSLGIANECINITPAQWPVVVKATRAELDRLGYSKVKITANEWPSNDDYAFKRLEAIKADPDAFKALDAICTHSYAIPPTYRFFEAFCDGTGKSYWQNESQGPKGVDVGAHIINDLNQGVSMWMHHEAVLGSQYDWANLVGYDRARPAEDPDFILLSQRYYYYKQLSAAIDRGCEIYPAWSNTELTMPYLYGPDKMLSVGGKNPDGSFAVALLSHKMDKPMTVQIAIKEYASTPSVMMNVWRSGTGFNILREHSIELKNGRTEIELQPRDLVTLRTATPSLPPNQAPSAPEASAKFVGIDTVTRGNWQGKYGANGVALPAEASKYHFDWDSGRKLRIFNGFSSINNDPPGASTNEDALPILDEKGVDRTGSYWHSFDGFGVEVTPGKDKTEQVAFYISKGATHDGSPLQEISVVDTATGLPLANQTVPDAKTGQYLIWQIKGNVTFRFKFGPQGREPVLNGIFLDPAVSAPDA